MADTKIEWADEVWNPVTGCDKVSPGCGLPRFDGDLPGGCYAMAMARRLKAMGQPKYQRDGKPPMSGPGFGVTTHPDALGLPLKWRKPRRVFVNSMSDLFHEEIPDEYIARVFAVMAMASQHTFQVLTKRHARMRAFLRDECRCGKGHAPGVHLRSAMDWAGTRHSPTYVPGVIGHEVYHKREWPLPNVWLGVSAEDQHWADIRVPALLRTPAAVRFVSAEPLIGPVDLRRHLAGHCPEHDFPGGFCVQRDHPGVQRLHWLIAGGESGPDARPMHPGWARSLRDQCQQDGTAYFFKQWGAWAPVEPDEWQHRRASDYLVRRDGRFWPLSQPHGLEDGSEATVRRAGKHAAGRLLDGREWNEYPANDLMRHP